MKLSKFKGVNNVASVNDLPPGFLRECVNFNVDNSGLLSQAQGYTLADGSQFSTIWSDVFRCFAVKNGDLVEVFYNDGLVSFNTLRTGVGNISISFAGCDGDYYYVSDTVSGIIRGSNNEAFGQTMVERQPTATAVNGGILQAGTYLIAATTIDDKGIESGTVDPASFVLAENNKGIQLSNFLALTGKAVNYVIYLSGQNGSELYRQGVIDHIFTPLATIYDVDTSTMPLNSIGVEPAPFGQLIAYHYGRLYIASGNELFYSEKYQYERWSRFNSYMYPSYVTSLMPCDSGIWLSTADDGLFWIAGTNPTNNGLTQIKKNSACLYRGSDKKIEGWHIKQQSHGWIATAKEGVFLLLDGGQWANETWDNISLPKFDACAGALVFNKDTLNYLSIISGAKVPAKTI